MTTFEITIIVIVILGLLLIGFMIYRFEILMSNAIAFFIRTGKQLSSVHADMYDDVGNHYLVEVLNKLDNIEDNILDESVGLPAICKKLDDLRIVAPELQGVLSDLAINSKGHYSELQQLREEIYNKRLLFELGTKSSPPCYAPNGICTNPQMDCINCPKIGTGGSWSTSTNLNKEE